MILTELLDRFAGQRVLVVGEAMLDSFAAGTADRICREAPVPIVSVQEHRDVPGGAANTAMAARALGAKVAMLSVVGQDESGDKLVGLLVDEGIDADGVLQTPGRKTLHKQRISANGQLLLRLDSGSEGALDELTERRLIEALEVGWAEADAIIVSDYGYGVCPLALIEAVVRLQRSCPRVLAVDAKDLARWRVAAPTAVKPNYAEALALISAAPEEGTAARAAQVECAYDKFADVTGASLIAVTLDVAGAVILEQGLEPYRTYTRPAPNACAAGAGDVFTATLALALAAGAPGNAAADLASASAALCVAHTGTSVCTHEALRTALAGERKIDDRASLEARLTAWRQDGRRIVFTNGCFDILHHGHITYLNRAKALGDVLIVGLNADASVRRLKGAARPINSEDDRAAVLAALGCIDSVIVFEEDTPSRLIEAVRPDLFVKGGDYRIDTLPEAPLVKRLGGEVKLLDFLDDRSTTGIIARIAGDAA